MDDTSKYKAYALLASTAVSIGIAGYFVYTLYQEKRKLETKQPLEVVGGHSTKTEHKDNESHTILIIGNKVYKPFQEASKGKKKSRGDVEAEFYKIVNELQHPLTRHLPDYHGIDTLDGRQYLVLSDITSGFEKPCILDIKMGRRAYDEEATQEKIDKEKKKYPPQEVIGFRFSGMKVYMPSTDETFESTREWCLSLQPGDIPNALEKFFSDGAGFRIGLIQALIDELSQIAKCLENHPKWRLYGSSLLIAYDGAKPAFAQSQLHPVSHERNVSAASASTSSGGASASMISGVYQPQNSRLVRRSTAGQPLKQDSNGTKSLSRKETVYDLNSHHYHDIRVKMIDFTHVFPIKDRGKDYGYLHGMHFLMSCLNELLDRNRPAPPQGLQRTSSLGFGGSKKARLDNSDNSLQVGFERLGSNSAMSEATDENDNAVASSAERPASTERPASSLRISPLPPAQTASASTTISMSISVGSPTVAVNDQIGGAHGNIVMTNYTISKTEDTPETFDTEAEFYELVTNENDSLSTVMPKLIKVSRDVTPRVLVLENALSLVSKPRKGGLLLSSSLISSNAELRVTPSSSSSSMSPSHRNFNHQLIFETGNGNGRKDTRQLSVGIQASSKSSNLGISNTASPMRTGRSIKSQKFTATTSLSQNGNSGSSSDLTSKSRPLTFSPSLRGRSPAASRSNSLIPNEPPKIQLGPSGVSPSQPSSLVPRKGSASSVGSQTSTPKSDAAHDQGDGVFHKPSIMDCKLGFRSFRNDAPNKPDSSYFKKYSTFAKELPEGLESKIWESIPEIANGEGPECLKDGKLGKRDYLSFRDASTTSLKHGFRLTALRHPPNTFEVSQDDARSITDVDQFKEKLEQYLITSNKFDVDVAKKFVEELHRIQHAIDDSKAFPQFEMVGTSLLFLHCNGHAAIRWIDFANTYKPASADFNGIKSGIEGLIQLLSNLINTHASSEQQSPQPQ